VSLSIHSFIHWSTWPAVGRCALHTTRSHAASAASPVSTSSCCIPDGEAGHVDVSTAACCRGGDQFLPGQPDAMQGRSDFWKSSYVTKHRTTSPRDLVTNSFLASPVYVWLYYYRLIGRVMTLTFDLWLWKPFQQCLLTGASFIEIPPISNEMLCHAK